MVSFKHTTVIIAKVNILPYKIIDLVGSEALLTYMLWGATVCQALCQAHIISPALQETEAEEGKLCAQSHMVNT